MKLSKSKLALAKVINDNGGWQIDRHMFATSNAFCDIFSYQNRPSRNGALWGGGLLSKCMFSITKKLPNWHQCVLSREEYYHAYPKADADGWIEWNGGECPVEKGLMVDIRVRDGREERNLAANTPTEGRIPDASCAFWKNDGVAGDIIAYRLHKPDVKPEVKPELCESVMRSIPEPEAEGVQSRLDDALAIVKVAAPHLLNEKYKFDGDEVMGERKPSIEQLAADYRNAKGHAERLQKEAGEAAVKAESFAVEIRKKILELQELIGISKPATEPELEITDWRDLMVGDEVECTEYDPAHRFGVVCRIDESSEEQPIMVNHGDGKGISWPSSWKFIRRP